MKTAVQIAQEIKKHKPIDKTNVMYDETWEDYMRGGRMTREEAILGLRFLRNSVESDVDYEIFDMAIKALEKENSDKQRYVVKGINNDKIEFVDKYSVRAFNRYVEFKEHEVLNKIRAEIEQKPQIRPKGHWIMTHDYFTGAYESIDYVECSCCHADSLEEGNYCPNCGAEMSEVVEE